MHIEKVIPYIPYILNGIPIIILISLIAALLGSLIGFLSALGKRHGGILGGIISAYIDFFRGTPVYVQLYFFYMGVPQVTGIVMDGMSAALIIFSLNSGAYLAEIMRAGIEGIDKGQIEAAKALGVSQRDITKDIVIPQAVRAVLPALVNEFITLTKETSVISIAGIADMMRRASIVQGSTYLSFEPLLIVLIAYYLLNKVLSFCGKLVERRLKYD